MRCIEDVDDVDVCRHLGRDPGVLGSQVPAVLEGGVGLRGACCQPDNPRARPDEEGHELPDKQGVGFRGDKSLVVDAGVDNTCQQPSQ